MAHRDCGICSCHGRLAGVPSRPGDGCHAEEGAPNPMIKTLKADAATVMPMRSGAFRFLSKRAQGGWMSREEAIMGTAIRVELWHENAALGESAMGAVMEEMH